MSNRESGRSGEPQCGDAARLDVFLLGPEEAVSCVCRDCGNTHGVTRRQVLYAGSVANSLAEVARGISPLLHDAVWQPDAIGIRAAVDAIQFLAAGLFTIRMSRGAVVASRSIVRDDAGDLMTFVEGYLAACRAYPTATVAVSLGHDRPEIDT